MTLAYEPVTELYVAKSENFRNTGRKETSKFFVVDTQKNAILFNGVPVTKSYISEALMCDKDTVKSACYDKRMLLGRFVLIHEKDALENREFLERCKTTDKIPDMSKRAVFNSEWYVNFSREWNAITEKLRSIC